MPKSPHPLEKTIEILLYKGVEFEVVERPDVLWVGCVDYAANNTDESDIAATLNRYRKDLIEVVKNEEINPDYSASLSINYDCSDKPCGLMFAQETYTDKQDERYDLFTQPGGLWLRVLDDANNAHALFGRDNAEPWEYFAGEKAPLQCAARGSGYTQNPNVHVQIEYHCHAEYSTPPHTNYAYIPVVKLCDIGG